MRILTLEVGVFVAVAAISAALMTLVQSVSASPQRGALDQTVLNALTQGNYAEAARRAQQLRNPTQAAALRGCALAMQRQYAQANAELQRAANALAARPRHETPYESLTAMRIASTMLAGQRTQAAALTRTFNRETAKRYAERYPRPAIVYGILLSLLAPDAAFTPNEAQQMLLYEDPAHEVRYYAQHLQAYLQIQRKQYRPALATLKRAYTDPQIAVSPPEAPQVETLLLEAYLHQQLGERAQMQTRLREAERRLQRDLRQARDETRLLHCCALNTLARALFPTEWKL